MSIAIMGGHSFSIPILQIKIKFCKAFRVGHRFENIADGESVNFL